MTRARMQTTRLDWRRVIARLIACVFLAQTIGLFAAPQKPVHSPAAQNMAAMQSMPDCPHHRHHSQPGHHNSGSDAACPMCQALGCALGGAIAPDYAFGAGRRLIGALRIDARAPSRAAPVLLAADPRGPPVLV